MACCDQPDPRPSLRAKTGLGLLGGKGCCCSPRVHGWGGQFLRNATGSATNANLLPLPGDRLAGGPHLPNRPGNQNFTGFQKASDAATPLQHLVKQWFPQFFGTTAFGACYQGRRNTRDIDPENADDPATPAATIYTVPTTIEPPIVPSTFDVRPQTSVLCQLPWVKFAHIAQAGLGYSGANIALGGGGLVVTLGLVEDGAVYGWGNWWPLPKYNEHWSSVYKVGQQPRSGATYVFNAASEARTWLSPIPMDFEVGTGEYVDVHIGSTALTGTQTASADISDESRIKLVLVDTAGDVHVGFHAPGQGAYEIGWNSYNLNAKSASVVGFGFSQYRVSVVTNGGSIVEMRFDRTTNELLETVTHQQAEFASIFLPNEGAFLFEHGALTNDGKIFIFFGENKATAGSPTNAVIAYDTNNSYTSAGMDSIFSPNGGAIDRLFIYGLRIDGSIVQINMNPPGSSSAHTISAPPPLSSRRKKFVYATFGGMSARSGDVDWPVFRPGTSVIDLPNYRLSILAIAEDGLLWGWGANRTYQLGLGDRYPRDYFEQVSPHKWKHVMLTTARLYDEPLLLAGIDPIYDRRGQPSRTSVRRSQVATLAILDSYADEEPLYFTGSASDGDWSNPFNWRFKAMPNAADSVIAEASITKNTGNRPTQVANFTQQAGALGIGLLVSGTAEFINNASIGAGVTVSGNAKFSQNAFNNGTVSGNATFNNNSLNNSSGRVNGNAIFNNASRNSGVIGTSQANAHQFNGTACNAGTVNGSVSVNGVPASSAPSC